METDFKKQLEEELVKKGLTASSVKLYLRNLERLNKKQPLKNLSFLKNVEAIDTFLSEYKENTKRNFLISICSALKTDKKYSKLYRVYFEKMMDKNKSLKEQESKNEKTDTQQKNWIEWSAVLEKQKELEEKVDKLPQKLDEDEYNTLLQYVILSLYVFKPPRRNEYMNMKIVKNDKQMDTKTNYLDLMKRDFVFNQFKTAKKTGQQVENIPDELMNVIEKYLYYHPLLSKKKQPKSLNIPFLVEFNGSQIDKSNQITRILNKIFGKKVGSSMLRHIFLSDKYGKETEEKKKDAESMGHSVAQQADYVKV